MNGEQRTLTFLFTAIEGAARLWDGQAQAMTGVLARHHAILQQVISTGGGHVFQVVGDEFCVAFEQITPALRTVVAAQHALLAEDWAAIGGLTRVEIAKQDYERATHLLAAAAALREASDNPVLASQREEFDRTMVALHQALDPERYAAAWAVGKAMTLEEAVAYASSRGKTGRG